MLCISDQETCNHSFSILDGHQPHQQQPQPHMQQPHPQEGYDAQQQHQEQAQHQQAGYDWNSQWNQQQYDATNWQQQQQYPQQQWENNQQPQPGYQDGHSNQGYQAGAYANHEGAPNESQAVGSHNHNVETGQHDQSGQGYQDVPLEQNVPPPAIVNDVQQNEASSDSDKPTLLTSNSFSKLPHTPSPFDEISGGLDVSQGAKQQENSFLGAPQYTPSHSRDSSMGGNVQFIVGSEPSSVSNSASQSPYPARPSPSDSPRTGEGSLHSSQVNHPETVPEELPSPPAPRRVDQGEGVMASGQSQQHYYNQFHGQYQQQAASANQVGNASGYHQQQQPQQQQSDFAAHGNWQTHKPASIPEQPPLGDGSMNAVPRNSRPSSVQSDARSDLSDSIGLKSSGGPVSPPYQRSVSQQSVQSVDSLNNAFGILPSARGRTTPQSQGQHGSPHHCQSSPMADRNTPQMQGTPPVTGPVAAGGVNPQPLPSPPQVASGGASGEPPFQPMAGSPKNMAQQGQSPPRIQDHGSGQHHQPQSFQAAPLETSMNSPGSSGARSVDAMQPDVVPAQDAFSVPSPVGAASSETAAAANPSHQLDQQNIVAEGAVHDISSGAQVAENFAPEASSSPMKSNTIVTPEEAQPAPGRPLSLNVNNIPPVSTNTAPISPDHQLNIYASPIQSHPDSPFQPPQKAASPAGSDITANYMAGAGPANMYNVGAGDTVQHQPQQSNGIPTNQTGAVHQQYNPIPEAHLPPKNVPIPNPYMQEQVGQPANQKQIGEQVAVVASVSHPDGDGSAVAPLTVAHHQMLAHERQTLSPATTLWENPTPASPVHLLKAAPPVEPPKNHIQPVEPHTAASSQPQLGHNAQPVNPQAYHGAALAPKSEEHPGLVQQAVQPPHEHGRPPQMPVAHQHNPHPPGAQHLHQEQPQGTPMPHQPQGVQQQQQLPQPVQQQAQVPNAQPPAVSIHSQITPPHQEMRTQQSQLTQQAAPGHTQAPPPHPQAGQHPQQMRGEQPQTSEAQKQVSSPQQQGPAMMSPQGQGFPQQYPNTAAPGMQGHPPQNVSQVTPPQQGYGQNTTGQAPPPAPGQTVPSGQSSQAPSTNQPYVDPNTQRPAPQPDPNANPAHANPLSKTESAPSSLDSRDDFRRQDSRYSTQSDTSVNSQSRESDQSRQYDDRSHNSRYSRDHQRNDRDPRYDNRYRDSRYDDRYRDYPQDRSYDDRSRYSRSEHDRFYDRPSSRGPVDQYGQPERPRSRQGPPDDPNQRSRSRQGHHPEDRYERPRSRQGKTNFEY